MYIKLLAMRNVDLYLFDANSYEENNLYSLLELKESDKEIIKKFKVEESRKEKAVSFHYKNKFVGQYYIDEFGKPLSRDIFFNISHSKGVVVFVTSKDAEIGVDVEISRQIEDDFVRFVCSSDELELVNKGANIFEIWTSKESLLKCIGIGIKARLNEVNSLPTNGLKKYNHLSYVSKLIKIENIYISITLKGEEDFNVNLHKNIL